MEERNENLSFNDEFRFKNKPDETTPKSAENMNVALDNTSYLKRELDKMNVVLKNMVITHEFTIFQGNQTFSDLIDDTWLCQCYSM